MEDTDTEEKNLTGGEERIGGEDVTGGTSLYNPGTGEYLFGDNEGK